MSTSKLILVTGASATGKTSIAKRIVARYHIPLISKDDFKEMLFDDVGWSNREWSRKIGKASYDIMYYLLKSQLIAKQSLLMESDFRPEFDVPRLLALKKEYNFDSLSIHCTTDTKTIFERFQARIDSGKRHPGHDDNTTIKELTPEILKTKFAPIDIGGQNIEIDTTDFDNVDFEPLWKTIDQFLSDRHLQEK